MSPRGGSGGGSWPYPEHRPRLPGPSAPRPQGRKAFGATWWGGAWVAALEGRARLDPNRLPRGRTYARTGAVGPLDLADGEVRAKVQGSRRAPYEVRVRVRRFDGEELGRLLDTLASEIGHAAALIDGELPPAVAADAAAAGVDLLPGAGELQTRCSCPDWAEPCKHAAAVCYLVADALDADPFAVFLLRGLGREALLSGLRARRRPDAATPTPAAGEDSRDPGLRAAAAFADTERRAAAHVPIPRAALTIPRRPGIPTVLASDPPPELDLDPAALRELAADAAARAFAVLHGKGTNGLELSEREDLARRAERLLGAERKSASDVAALARRSGRRARDLLAEALAYRYGGTDALEALAGDATPDSGAVAAARRHLGPSATIRANRVTAGDRQLRAGPGGRWYPLRRDRAGQWLPDGPALSIADFGPDPAATGGNDDRGVGSLDDGTPPG